MNNKGKIITPQPSQSFSSNMGLLKNYMHFQEGHTDGEITLSQPSSNTK